MYLMNVRHFVGIVDYLRKVFPLSCEMIKRIYIAVIVNIIRNNIIISL